MLEMITNTNLGCVRWKQEKPVTVAASDGHTHSQSVLVGNMAWM